VARIVDFTPRTTGQQPAGDLLEIAGRVADTNPDALRSRPRLIAAIREQYPDLGIPTDKADEALKQLRKRREA